VVVIIKLALGIALIVLAAVQWRRRNRARRAPAWLAGRSIRLLAIEGGR
jgi:hypothetical protein